LLADGFGCRIQIEHLAGGRYCTWPSYCDALPLPDQRAALP
jgi:hypothetical protein